MYKKENNYAFIDVQNLYMSTAKGDTPWKINLSRFRIYLQKKYQVEKAYYFLGFSQEQNNDLYKKIKDAGFILIFKEHSSGMFGKKKGNVDSDIIFSIMKKLYKIEPFNKIVLVSGDGDYKMIVDFLIEEDKLCKILFPNKQFASSLYKTLSRKYIDYMEHLKKDISL